MSGPTARNPLPGEPEWRDRWQDARPGDSDTAPTVEDVRRDPYYWIIGAGQDQARRTLCPHGYTLVDSCPNCDQDADLGVPSVPPQPTVPQAPESPNLSDYAARNAAALGRTLDRVEDELTAMRAERDELRDKVEEARALTDSVPRAPVEALLNVLDGYHPHDMPADRRRLDALVAELRCHLNGDTT